MALTFTPERTQQAANPIALAGGWWLVPGDLAFSGTYPAGGETLDLRKYVPQLSAVRRVMTMGNARGVDLEYLVTTTKLKLWQAGASPAVAEYVAGAYDADLTASAIPVVFMIK